MNEVITKLYEIEETAGTILKNAQEKKEKLQEQMKEEQRLFEQELNADLKRRIAQAKESMTIKSLKQEEALNEKYEQQILALDELYDGQLDTLAEEIFLRMTEV